MRMPYQAWTRLGVLVSHCATERVLWQKVQFTPSDCDMLIMIAKVFSASWIGLPFVVIAIAAFEFAVVSAIPLGTQRRWLCIPGSVGQPRDRDPRAAWLLWERDELGAGLGTATWRRVEYNIPAAQEAIDAAEVMNGARTRTRVPGTEATDDILDRRVREALARGFEDGYAQADAAVRAEFAARERLLAPIVESARQAAATLDERVAQHVLDLALAIAAQVVRSDLAVAPRHFVELVHEGLGLIAEGTEARRVGVAHAPAAVVRRRREDLIPGTQQMLAQGGGGGTQLRRF